MTTSTRAGPTAVEDLKQIRRTLQDAGITLLQVATAAVSAAAKETLSATRALLSSADDTLASAEKKVRKLRAEQRARR